MSFTPIHDRAANRWGSLLPALGVSADYLTGKHGPCPCCDGGTDRFRYDDKGGKGTWICSKCGAGNGVDLVMRVNGVDFRGAVKLIEPLLPDAQVVVPKPRREIDTDHGLRMWRQGQRLTGYDPASWYLTARGVAFEPWPTQLRFQPRMPYHHDDKSRTEHPAMLALFVSPDAQRSTAHVTYLTTGGGKADLPKVRKMAPGPIPQGGAVRLFPSAETMGIAEGIETALAAAKLFDVPVWSALSAGNLMKWEPPKSVRNVIVFGDNDASFAGQNVSFGLAHRLKSIGLNVEVRLPDDVGDDWNDVLTSGADPVGVQEAAE